MDLTTEEMMQFENGFNILNRDGDGSVTSKELGAFIRALGLTPNENEMQAMINEADLDGNGSIEFPEFLAMLTQKMCNTANDDELREAFRILDKSSNGYITLEDLKFVMTNLGQKATDDELEELIRDADADQDGCLNYEEFVTMMTERQE